MQRSQSNSLPQDASTLRDPAASGQAKVAGGLQSLLFSLLLGLTAAGCGTKPGGPEDDLHLLTGRWQFEATDSELFDPARMLVAQSDEDTRVLLEGTLFATHFERFAVSAAAPQAFVLQISFARLEQAPAYEVLTLALDGRLVETDRLEGGYEVRGNLDSGGELHLESGTFSATRLTTGPAAGRRGP